MPNCKLCESTFPNRIKIDGIVKNLKNRKFCLVCSPFGQRNTKNLVISNSKSKVCPKCKEKKDISKFTRRKKDSNSLCSYCKTCYANRYNGKRKKTKQLCVEYKGSKCIICSYDKCLSSLHFHHLDPFQKSFSISDYTYSIDKLKSELDKCILVCANCHGEIEEGLIVVPVGLEPT